MHPEILIPITAILMPVVLVPTVLVLRQASRRREWQHLERMKAMDLGLPAPGSGSSRTAIAIGAAMPVGVFACSWLASLTTGIEEVWIAAAFVGGAGVIGGTWLAGRALSARERAAGDSSGAVKPRFDPDAYESIVRHG